MSSPHSEEVRALYAAFGRGDIAAILSSMSEDVDWNVPGGAPFCGLRHGRDQVRAFFEMLSNTTRLDEFDLDEIVGDGERVVALGRERGTVIETDRHFEQKFAHLYTFRGGKIAAVHIFDDSHAVASAFGESTREREALTGPLGTSGGVFSGHSDQS